MVACFPPFFCKFAVFVSKTSFSSIHFLLFFSLLAGTCLRDLKIYVPEAVAVGDAVTLSCHYNLENVSIRSTISNKSVSKRHNIRNTQLPRPRAKSTQSV